jgi:hypothetical protein
MALEMTLAEMRGDVQEAVRQSSSGEMQLALHFH